MKYEKMKWIVVFLVISSGILFYIGNKKIEEQNKQMHNIQQAYYEIIKTNYESWQIMLTSLKHIKLVHKDGYTENILNVLIGKKIVFYFTNKMCEVCVEKGLNNLKYMGSVIGYENIIIIGEKINPRMYMNEIFLPFSQNLWKCDESIYEGEIQEEVPIISLVDNHNMKLVYCLPKMTNDLDKMFKKMVIDEFIYKKISFDK